MIQLNALRFISSPKISCNYIYPVGGRAAKGYSRVRVPASLRETRESESTSRDSQNTALFYLIWGDIRHVRLAQAQGKTLGKLRTIETRLGPWFITWFCDFGTQQRCENEETMPRHICMALCIRYIRGWGKIFSDISTSTEPILTNLGFF